MDFSAILTLIVLAAAAILLVSERLRPDLIALMVMLTLGLGQVLSPEQTFAGFSGSAVITILGISIISEGLRQTGSAQMLGSWMHRLGRGSEARLIAATMLISAFVSLFMNNIAAVGVVLPAVATLARRTGTRPWRLMMPLAFGTTLGGMATLLTTSNIILSGALREAGQQPFGLLDFLPIGIPVVLVGTLYMVTAGRALLPAGNGSASEDRFITQSSRLSRLYRLSRDMHLLKILPDCPVVRQSLRQADWGRATGLNILGIVRGKTLVLAPRSDEILQPYDQLLVQGRLDPEKLSGYCLKEIKEKDLPEIADQATTLAEAVIAPHAGMIGKSLAQVRFREKYGLNVAAIWRDGKPILSNLGDLTLRYGDTLLLHGPAGAIHLLNQDSELILLEEDPDAVLRPSRHRTALAITALTLAAASITNLPVAEVVLAGAVLMLLTGCLSLNEAYRNIEWKAIFLIAGMWPLSTALTTTGLAVAGIEGVQSLFPALSPLGFAALLMAAAFLLTQLMSGQVAALVLAPLALAAAAGSGLDARGLAMAVALGCSLAFATPFGHPVNIMVMSPGGYTLKDYLRVGLPLTVLVYFTVLGGLALFWGLR